METENEKLEPKWSLELRERIIKRIEDHIQKENYVRVGWAVEQEMGLEYRKSHYNIRNKVAATIEKKRYWYGTRKYKREVDGDNDWGITYREDVFWRNLLATLIATTVGFLLTFLK